MGLTVHVIHTQEHLDIAAHLYVSLVCVLLKLQILRRLRLHGMQWSGQAVHKRAGGVHS